MISSHQIHQISDPESTLNTQQLAVIVYKDEDVSKRVLAVLFPFLTLNLSKTFTLFRLGYVLTYIHTMKL